MPKLVTELEITEPPAPLFVDRQYEGISALVTLEGLPLCTFELNCDPVVRTISAERLHQEVIQHGAWPMWVKAIERRFDRPETSNPPISVVVCTRDRARLLQECLESLSRLDYPEYEVVVVDNCSSDPQTAAVIDKFGFRNIYEDRPGLDWARNRGAAEARHDIVAYIDDDARASSGWLRWIACGFHDPAVMAVTGLVLPSELDTEAQLLFERYGGMNKGFQPSSFTASSLPEHGIFAAHQFGVGANMAFRRQVFERVGTFDTMLDTGTPSGGAGDLDMFHRVIAAGLTLRYEPGAFVRHRHRRSYAGLREQIYANGKSYGVFLIKTWREGSTPGAARYSAHWLSGWVVRRLFRSIIGREKDPRDLIWAEFRGALAAPIAYLATLKNDRRIRELHGCRDTSNGRVHAL